jgi:hypothetical protein
MHVPTSFALKATCRNAILVVSSLWLIRTWGHVPASSDNGQSGLDDRGSNMVRPIAWTTLDFHFLGPNGIVSSENVNRKMTLWATGVPIELGAVPFRLTCSCILRAESRIS